jgi:hypothetical protein
MIDVGLMPFGAPVKWAQHEIPNGVFARWA